MRYSSKAGAALLLLLALSVPSGAAAQEAATITGRVTSTDGKPEQAVLVRIEQLNVGTSTDATGNYRLMVPGARIRVGAALPLTASRRGLAPSSRTISLAPGNNLTQNFKLGPAVILID